MVLLEALSPFVAEGWRDYQNPALFPRIRVVLCTIGIFGKAKGEHPIKSCLDRQSLDNGRAPTLHQISLRPNPWISYRLITP